MRKIEKWDISKIFFCFCKVLYSLVVFMIFRWIFFWSWNKGGNIINKSIIILNVIKKSIIMLNVNNKSSAFLKFFYNYLKIIVLNYYLRSFSCGKF